MNVAYKRFRLDIKQKKKKNGKLNDMNYGVDKTQHTPENFIEPV